MADRVTLRSPEGREFDVEKSAVPFFPDHTVLTADGRVNSKATAAVSDNDKKEN